MSIDAVFDFVSILMSMLPFLEKSIPA